jgi:hypothetical protein
MVSGEPFGTEYSARQDSLTNERISENSVLVNTMEKITPAEFSIREFGSVSHSGSQIFSTTSDPSSPRKPGSNDPTVGTFVGTALQSAG